MNYLDLFSGIGGFALGFQRAGWKFDKHYFSEINPYAIKVYQRHFPDAIPLGSITGIKPEELGQVDLITFGFPCQDLSIAGKRAGLAGSRSGLFFEAMRLIRFLRPSIFIFENVKGLLTSNQGQDFETVLREIADVGLYECEWQLLNTSWFLPQNRERIYFIGHLGERGGRKVFPIGCDGESSNGSNGGGSDTSQTVTARYQASTSQGSYVIERDEISEQGISQLNNPKHSNDRVYGQWGGQVLR
jgi:DNA (cytosine-5)-methyltransferase 1